MQSRIKLCNWPHENGFFASHKPAGLSDCSGLSNLPAPKLVALANTNKVKGFTCNIVLRHLRVFKQTRLRVCVKISQDLDDIIFGWVHNKMLEKEGGGARRISLSVLPLIVPC